jgi:hypothetical protein
MRLPGSIGIRCEVIAPSMIPKAPGDKVKTDKRDCCRLARLHRAGELVAIRLPTPDQGWRTRAGVSRLPIAALGLGSPVAPARGFRP